MKALIKKSIRRTLSVLNGLGLGLLMRRLGFARGAGIVMTHCVGHVSENEYLPADMKTSADRVERLLRALKRRGVQCVTVREVVEALDRGEAAKELLAFTMDDGYRDNYTVALPLLEKYGVTGTVFVETHVIGTRVVSWLHRYFWIVKARDERFFAEEYARRTNEPEIRERILVASKGGLSSYGAMYDLKRALKYEADLEDRERVSREILESIGVTDEDVAKSYLTWGEIVDMDRRGIEIGAHTVHHEILSRLDRDGIRREIIQSTESIRGQVEGSVDSFAYPFGRPWDYNEDCYEVLGELGYRSAAAAIDGTNDPQTDRWQLRRLPLNDDIPVSDILAEIDGTFPLARRLLRMNL